MSSIVNVTPIHIHIPPSLTRLAITPSEFLQENPTFTNLAVGACIFAPLVNCQSGTASPRLLLVQRAATERGFPNRWEVPGRSAEVGDPTLLHSVAREVFEETGLRLTRFVRAVGDGIQFTTGKNATWMKLTFEIEVQEDVSSSAAGTADGATMVKLDPAEHQALKWISEAELENWGPGQIVTEEQRQLILQAFKDHSGDRKAYGG